MKKIIESIEKLDHWIIKNNFKGYEPFDGLSSFLAPLTLNQQFLMRILQQVVLRCPFHIRPFLGVIPLESTKGMGFFGKGYLKLWSATGKKKYRESAYKCLNWLIKNQTNGFHGACWGNHFNYASRGGTLPKFSPSVVWTSLIGHTFFDAYELTKEEKFLKTAQSACAFIIKDLPKEDYSDGTTCIGYVVHRMQPLHNSNLLAASLLSRNYQYTMNEKTLELIKKAVLYSLNRQLSDGSWYYGERKTYHWIDNWHTAYNLDALKWCLNTNSDVQLSDALLKGYFFYKNNFFKKDGTPKYYHNKIYPVDIQSASQSIDTLCFFSEIDSEAIKLAKTVAEWTIRNMQDSSGYFYYRILPWKRVKIPMIHWGQATMLSALSHLYLKLQE